ncbi:MAG: hypothetical protein ACI8TP_004703, partial [Acidimicrobiales bacterium]
MLSRACGFKSRPGHCWIGESVDGAKRDNDEFTHRVYAA